MLSYVTVLSPLVGFCTPKYNTDLYTVMGRMFSLVICKDSWKELVVWFLGFCLFGIF